MFAYLSISDPPAQLELVVDLAELATFVRTALFLLLRLRPLFGAARTPYVRLAICCIRSRCSVVSR